MANRLNVGGEEQGTVRTPTNGLDMTRTPASGVAELTGVAKGVHRINVNFSRSAYETLEQLAAAKGKSMSEVLRDAIQLEKWLTDAQAEGWHVLFEKDGKVRELVRI